MDFQGPLEVALTILARLPQGPTVERAVGSIEGVIKELKAGATSESADRGGAGVDRHLSCSDVATPASFAEARRRIANQSDCIVRLEGEIGQCRREIEKLREVIGERYTLPQYPGTIFTCKDAARAAQNVWDNCGKAEEEVKRLRAAVTELKKQVEEPSVGEQR